MPLPLPLLAPAYYLCHYSFFYYQYYFYHYYYYCCTCSTVPKHPELTTDKSPRLHCRGTPLATMTTSLSWTWLAGAIDWTWRFKEWFGKSVSMTSLSLISTDPVQCPLKSAWRRSKRGLCECGSTSSQGCCETLNDCFFSLFDRPWDSLNHSVGPLDKSLNEWMT